MGSGIAIRLPIVVIQYATIVSFTKDGCTAGLKSGRYTFFLHGHFFAFFNDGVQVGIFRLLYDSRGSVVEGGEVGVIMASKGMFFYVFRDPMSFTSDVLGYLYIAFFLEGCFFPIPLIGVREISIIYVFVAACHARVYMGSFTKVRVVVLRYVSLPFYGEVGSLYGEAVLFFSIGKGQAFGAIWIVVRAEF